MLKVLLTIGFLQVLTMLVQLVRTKALALLLGPEMFGAMAVIDKLLQVITQTLSLSMPYAALRFLPPLWTRDPRAFVALFRQMRRLITLLIAVALGIAALVTVVAPGAWGAQLLPYHGILLAAFLTLPVLALVPFLQNAIAGRLQQYHAMAFALLHTMVFTATAVVGVWWRGLSGFYLLYATFGLVLIAWTTRRIECVDGVQTPPPAEGRIRAWFSLRLPRPMWNFSAALVSLTFLSPYAALAIQYQVLSRFGAGAAGWMQAAVGVSLAVRGVLGSAHSVFLTPQVNKEGTPVDRLYRATEFQKTFLFLVGVAVPPLLLLPRVAIQLLYSSAFLPGAVFVVLFVLVEVMTLIAGTYQALIIAHDHMLFHVIQNIIAQLLLVGVATALIPRLGIAGAAIGGLCAQALLYAGTLIFLHRRHELSVPGRQYALIAFVLAVLAVTGAVGVRYAALTPTTLALKVALYAACVGILALFLTSDDRANLRRLVEGLRARRRPA